MLSAFGSVRLPFVPSLTNSYLFLHSLLSPWALGNIGGSGYIGWGSLSPSSFYSFPLSGFIDQLLDLPPSSLDLLPWASDLLQQALWTSFKPTKLPCWFILVFYWSFFGLYLRFILSCFGFSCRLWRCRRAGVLWRRRGRSPSLWARQVTPLTILHPLFQHIYISFQELMHADFTKYFNICF